MAKKVLIVSHIDLFPTNAGNRKRIVDTICFLKKCNFDVYFMNFGVVLDYYQKIRYARFLGEGKYFCYEKYDYKFKERAEQRRISNESIYYDVDELIPSGFGKFARKIIRDNKFDVIIAEYVIASYVLTLAGKRTLKIIDTHDIMTDRDKLFIESGEKPQGIYFKKEEEIRGLKRADIVWAIQSEEERILKDWLLPHTKVVMVGNPMEIVDIPLIENKKILFIGSGNTLNTSAAKWLIDEVIPLVKNKEPDAEFLIGGTVCNKIEESNQYTKLGFVEDATKLYEQVRIVVNPIKGGTGLNIKTMEALSYGKPLVSTSVGVKGLKKIDSFIMVRDDPEGFADSIVKLLQSLELCRNIQKKTYKYMEFYNSL